MFKTAVKTLALTKLPSGVQRRLKLYHYGRVLRRVNEHTEPEFKIVKHLVRRGDRVVDIGANIGVYTKYLSALVGPEGRVVGVEPVPLTFEVLSANVRRLHLHNVELVRTALSEANGDAIMEIPLYAGGGENFYMARIVPTESKTRLRRVAVQTRTLDDLVGPSCQASFIKCDVEGHELACLRGARMVITASQPAWLLEVSGDPESAASSARHVFELLQTHGYEAHVLDDDTGLLKTWRTGMLRTNYFFLAPRHVEFLRGKRILV